MLLPKLQQETEAACVTEGNIHPLFALRQESRDVMSPLQASPLCFVLFLAAESKRTAQWTIQGELSSDSIVMQFLVKLSHFLRPCIDLHSYVT